EDGMRYDVVTGVQWCALPLSFSKTQVGNTKTRRFTQSRERTSLREVPQHFRNEERVSVCAVHDETGESRRQVASGDHVDESSGQIGRASCRVGEWGGGGEDAA